MCFFSFTLFEKNTTVLPLGYKQYNTIGCIHTTMLECKELTYDYESQLFTNHNERYILMY